MSSIKEKAYEQAHHHAKKFFNEEEWLDVLEKYAEVSNRYSDEVERFVQRRERGAYIEEEDKADLYYYECYYDLFAHWIANTELKTNGYERDKRNNWILKKPQPVSPMKKKFGFWR